MGLAKEIAEIKIEDYLAGEKISQLRHEYIDGQVFAMAGASKRHNRISQNIGFLCRSRLVGSDCESFVENVKLRADAVTFYYPDVVVTCEKSDDEYVIHEPILIIEVISPTTERTDRYEKLQVYRRIPTLLEYAIVWQDEMLIEIHRRADAENWTIERYNEPEETINFDSINLAAKLSDIYQNIEF